MATLVLMLADSMHSFRKLTPNDTKNQVWLLSWKPGFYLKPNIGNVMEKLTWICCKT